MARGETYDQFVAKFERKKTTDDCYTPPQVYDAVLAWVLNRWPHIDPGRVKRPFRPDGDYQAEADTYIDGDVVIDNPPFSILAQIRRFYQGRGIPHFLFAPSFSMIQPRNGGKYVFARATITYHNGAQVATGFVHNLPGPTITVAPDLHQAIRAAQDSHTSGTRANHYTYPREYFNASLLESAALHGIHLTLDDDQVIPTTRLDGMPRPSFGRAFLVNPQVAADLHARLDAARSNRVISLSNRERQAVNRLRA